MQNGLLVPDEFIIGVDEQGRLQFPANPELEAMFKATSSVTKRASNILPSTLAPRLAFQLLRKLFTDKGKVAEWTREWRCRWIVDMRPSGGPILPTAWKSRAAALRVEKAWLELYYL